MSRKFFAAIIFALVLGIFAGAAFADDSYFVREEAARRNMHLISVEQAKSIAEGRLNSRNVIFKDVDLDNEADDYPNGTNFRPVYQIECLSGGQEYDIDIDAVTGQVLKFKLDD
ncbi:MAG: PepSY domain-containing protein [Synergistaceae bacterium]|nr:PepSY domain-containing protein [Synergistaceae bacterium]